MEVSVHQKLVLGAPNRRPRKLDSVPGFVSACEVGGCTEAEGPRVVGDVGHDPVPSGVVRRAGGKLGRGGGDVGCSTEDEKETARCGTRRHAMEYVISWRCL